VLSAADLRAIYRLLDVGQTVDTAGHAVDCGQRCDKFCCRPGNTTKYLLPGEREFLEDGMRARGDPPFAFKNKLDYDKGTDTMVLYEDDGTTPKSSHTMTDDASNATRGAGA